MTNNVFIEALKNFLDEDQLGYIQKGIAEGFTSEQIGIYAKPQFIGEEMEVIFYAIKDGLTKEQINLAIEKADDFWQMDDICNGFKVGISLEEMKDITSATDWPDLLSEKIRPLLEAESKKNMEIGEYFAAEYKKENKQKMFTGAAEAINLFKEKYIESGWQYNGCFKHSELLEKGVKKSVINKLVDKGFICERNSTALTYELPLIERFSLIKEYNLNEQWAKTGGDSFRLNNGYNGEYHVVLRNVVKMEKDFRRNKEINNIINYETDVNGYVDIINEAWVGNIKAKNIDQLMYAMDFVNAWDEGPYWSYPVNEKDYCIEEGIVAILVRDDRESRFFELPPETYDIVRRKITDGEIKETTDILVPLIEFKNEEEFIHRFFSYLHSKGIVRNDSYGKNMIACDVYNLRGKEWLEDLKIEEDNKCYFKYLCKQYGEFEDENFWVTVYKDTLGYQDDHDNLTEICVPTDWLLDYLLNENINPDEWVEEYIADNSIEIAEKAISEGVIKECADENIDISKFWKNTTKQSSLEDKIQNAEVVKSKQHRQEEAVLTSEDIHR